MKIMMIANDTNFAYNLRREILQQNVLNGHEVILVAQILNYKKELENIGVNIIDLKNNRHGKNPFNDLMLLFKYYNILKMGKPNLVFTNNIKPNVYAGLSCRLLGIKYIPNITGLGTPLENPGILQKITTLLYKVGINGASTIFFQNLANEEFFKKNNLISKHSKVVLLPGSGVNIDLHKLLAYPIESKEIHFLYIARVMQEKGIDIVLSVAKKIVKEHNNIIFDIVGQCDDISYLKRLKKAEKEGWIKYHGLQKDVTKFYAKCSCFLYPSYYPEGMSNVLLEAAASGRPVIATNRPGCKETVDAGVSGYIVPIKNENAVLEAVKKFLNLNNDERKQMGLAGREKMVNEFDRKIVVEAYRKEINRILGEK